MTVYSGALEEALDQRGLLVVAHDPLHLGDELRPALDARAGRMPFAVPSQRGFTKSGKAPGSAASRASSAERTTHLSGTGTPAAATSVRVQALSSESGQA